MVKGARIRRPVSPALEPAHFILGASLDFRGK
jgi:hypothetical protein